MTATDPFTYPAEHTDLLSANHAATAKELVDRADEKLLNADHSEPGARISRRESAMRDVEMAKVFALLAVTHELKGLRVEVISASVDMQETAIAVREVVEVLDGGLFELANPLPQPRWWQFWRRADGSATPVPADIEP